MPVDAHSESRFRAIFASEPECVKLIGPDGNLIEMNPAGLRMIEAASIEAVRGCNILELIDPAYHQAFRDTVAAVFRGESTHIQFEVVGLQGKRLWMDQSAAPLRDPNDPSRVVEMVTVTRDVTAQRQAEEALLRARLDEEISRSKSEFLANVSQELKTPLDHIIGYSELLQEAALEQGRPSDAADHQRILDAASQLLSMVNQMLSISSIDARRHKVSVDECDINVLIHDAVEALRPAAEANGNTIALEIADEAGLWSCDSSKIDQCLRCLLSNAAAFTHNGAITIRAGRVMLEDLCWLQLDVIDTGRGIEPSKLETLFQPFARAEESRDRGKVGLSLAVTRQLARLMGGDLTVASAPGRGSHFSLRVRAEFHPDAAAATYFRAIAQS